MKEEISEKAEELEDVKVSIGAKLAMNPFFRVITIILMCALIVAIVRTVVLYVLSLLTPLVISGFFWGFFWELLFVVIVIERIYRCWELIPNKPPEVGLITFWGKRLPIVKREGWHFLGKILPFLYSVITIKIEKRNVDLTFSDVRTIEKDVEETEKGEAEEGEQKGEKKLRAGGELEIHVSYTYQPEYRSKNAGKHLTNFIDSGGDKGVQDIIRDQIAENLREMARTNSWEEITFSTGEIKESIVKRLTGQKFKEIEKEMNTNGVPDIHSLGILIRRFNMGKIKELGELAKEAGALEVTKQKIKGFKAGLTFVREEMEPLIGLGVGANEALDAVQIQMRIVNKEVQTFRGLDKGTEVIGMAAARLFGKSKTSETKKKEKK
jgi:hypothetical protein